MGLFCLQKQLFAAGSATELKSVYIAVVTESAVVEQQHTNN